MRHFSSIFSKTNIQKVTIYGSIITLTGTDGTADITINNVVNTASASFSSDLTTTASNWVAANLTYYKLRGYAVSASAGVITVVPESDWDTVNRINASITNLTEDLSGTLTGVFEPDFSKAKIWDVTFTMNSEVVSPRNAIDGDRLTFMFRGTGSYTIDWGSTWGFPGGAVDTSITTDTTTIRATYNKDASIFVGNSGESWSSYWSHQSEVLFFGLYSEISGGQMPNKVTGATDFLTVAGVAGSETFQAPNTAPYQTADTDYIWFKTDVSQRTTTTAELIGYDFTRTIVKYGNSAPNTIEAIMILSSDVDTNKMRDDFDLSVWWSNVLSAYGNVKDNRGVGKSVWTAESVYSDEYIAVYNEFTTKPSDEVAAVQDQIIKDIKTGSAWDVIDGMWLFAGHTNGASESLINWKSPASTKATLENAPPFTAYEGFAGEVAATRSINLQWNDGANFSLDAASVIIGTLDSGTAGWLWGSGYWQDSYSGSGYNCTACVNNGAVAGTGTSQGTHGIGYYTITRTASNNSNWYKNKGAAVTGAYVSGAAVSRFNLTVLANATGAATRDKYGDGKVSVFVVGNFTEAQKNTIIDAIEVYMDSNGKSLM